MVKYEAIDGLSISEDNKWNFLLMKRMIFASNFNFELNLHASTIVQEKIGCAAFQNALNWGIF